MYNQITKTKRMNMKKFIVLSILNIMFASVTPSFANEQGGYDDGRRIEIVLSGQFNNDQARSEEPIEIYHYSSMLLIHFNVPLGVLDIIIENENGNVVYSSSTNTSSRLVNMIPTSNFPNGDYTIIIEGDNGSAEAHFSINR